jgi:hypothetical protein
VGGENLITDEKFNYLRNLKGYRAHIFREYAVDLSGSFGSIPIIRAFL